MEKKHRCELCFRNFAKGRALSGHMRSHMMNLDDSSKNHKEREETESIHRSYSSPSSCSLYPSDDDEEEAKRPVNSISCRFKENPKKSSIFADHEFSSDLVQESLGSEETESSKENIAFAGSKRKFISSTDDDDEFSSLPENEYSSSISDTTTEEHLAHCLMMLSRDKWDREEILEYNSNDRSQEDDDDKDHLGFAKKSMMKRNNGNKVRGRYRCETCNKLFKSYQALGGHRASHKKIRPEKPVVGRIRPEERSEKLHKCPFCERVFASGQALGGHKRTHTVNGGGNNHANGDERLIIDIDLNLPASVDRDDGIVSSEFGF